MNKVQFFDEVRPLFGGKLSVDQVSGMERLLKAWELYGDGDIQKESYILATSFHETGHRMQPVKETTRASDKMPPSDATVVSRLDYAFKAGQLKWVRTPYWRFDAEGKAWFGRGDVQNTHKVNYIRAGDMIGEDLVTDPNRALNPETSAKILILGSLRGIFTGKKLGDYIGGGLADYYNARKVINSLDRAGDVAEYARAFETALRSSRIDETPVTAVADPAQVVGASASANVYLRQSPVDGKVILTIPKDHPVKIDDTWCKITVTIDGHSYVGWSARRLLKDS